MPSQSSLLGAAGEHYVLCQLLRRGYIAALAPLGVPNADILITDIDGQRLVAIQVKTRRNIGSDKGWHMKPKHETLVSPTLFYCFVDFGDGLEDRTKTHVVPSAVVAAAIKESHQHWLKTPGKKGQAHKDSKVRRFQPDYTKVFGASYQKYGPNWIEPYLEGWTLLGQPRKADSEIDEPELTESSS
jgi:hypothetical protein